MIGTRQLLFCFISVVPWISGVYVSWRVPAHGVLAKIEQVSGTNERKVSSFPQAGAQVPAHSRNRSPVEAWMQELRQRLRWTDSRSSQEVCKLLSIWIWVINNVPVSYLSDGSRLVLRQILRSKVLLICNLITPMR